MLKYISSPNKMQREVGFSTDLFRNSLPKLLATHYSESVLRNNLTVLIANSSIVDSSMFHEVLVIPYIKICEFELLSPRGIFVFFWNVLSVLEAQETKNKSSSLTLTKASQTVHVVLLKNTQLFTKLL